MELSKLYINEVNTDICEIVLNDISTMNALDLKMRSELADVMSYIEKQSFRVLIIRGKGKAFSAGGNIAEMKNIASAEEGSKRLIHIHEFINQIRNWDGIVIASIHGYAAGAGMNLALCCDYIIASEETKFIQSFSKIGLIPDCGGFWLLPRLLGPIKAKEVMLLGKSVDVEEYYRLGLINKVVKQKDLYEETMKVAEDISNGPKIAFKFIKQMVNDSFDKTFDQTLKEEAIIQGICMESADFKEGVNAFLSKRKPSFAK